MNPFEQYSKHPIRSASVLTGAYVSGNILSPIDGVNLPAVSPSRYNQMIILADFTIGSLTDAQIKIEFSPDGITYYQETADSSPSSGVVTETVIVRKLTATGKYRIAVPIKDNYIKISVIGTGTVTSSTITLDAVLGTV